MNFLLPQERLGTLREVRTLDIHSDHYLDVWIEFDEPAGETRRGRLPASECPANLVAGERVSVKFVMGVMVKVSKSHLAKPAPAEDPSGMPPPV